MIPSSVRIPRRPLNETKDRALPSFVVEEAEERRIKWSRRFDVEIVEGNSSFSEGKRTVACTLHYEQISSFKVDLRRRRGAPFRI